MKSTIRKMNEDDRSCVIEMMRIFYASPAVLSGGSEEIFNADIDACVGESPYIEGYVFEGGGEIRGYAMVAKSFSTEFGAPCVWIEDIYIKEEYRGLGLWRLFLERLEREYGGALFRLEVEAGNENAINAYKKMRL